MLTRSQAVGASLLATSLLGNIVLGHLVRRPIEPAQQPLTIGTPAPPVALLEPRSQPGPRGTILYFTSPNCPPCSENAAAARSLFAAVTSLYQIIEVAPEHAIETESDLSPGADIERLRLSAAAQERFPAEGLPQTVVIDAAGTVVFKRVGAYLGDGRNEVEQFFKVRLSQEAVPVESTGATPYQEGQ